MKVQIQQSLEEIALAAAMLDYEDIPAMGELLNLFLALKGSDEEWGEAPFPDILDGLIAYLEKMILSETTDVEPINEGVNTLQAICRSVERGEAFTQDPAEVLAKLGCGEARNSAPQEKKGAVDDTTAAESGRPHTWAQDEIDILNDFVSESRDNIEAIEMHLIDLEQSRGDKEAVNAVFRMFHTIKGVSGFLNLEVINRLTHNTENLLDRIRTDEIQINNTLIDLILESVDMVKTLLDEVDESLSSGTYVEKESAPLKALVHNIENYSGEPAEEHVSRLGTVLLTNGVISRETLHKALALQKESPGKKLGEVLVENGLASAEAIEAALSSQQKQKSKTSYQVKVDIQKLDNLVDLTGELVISQSMIRQHPVIRSCNDNALNKNLNQLSQIVTGLQQTAMSMRMVPIKNTFQKMVRLVRDLSKSKNKNVELKMSGEDTEIDRNVVDALYEPLVHMIRNAVDHGIEMPEERDSSGKPKKATVFLKAYHKGNTIVIEIQDDGKGLDKERILQKALSQQLISEDADLSDSEIYDLIFHPGFSTAATVTDVSGRGVGMDVVKRGIESLRGRLEIDSEVGVGTTFTIHLPLTLAIIEGMNVRVGMERYIIPTITILESFRPKPEQCHTVSGKGEMVEARGELIPLIRLAEVFHVRADFDDPSEGLVVVVEHRGRKRGLFLDELLGKEEIVIKSLGETLKNIKGVAGGAILEDGRIGLILDIEGLFELA